METPDTSDSLLGSVVAGRYKVEKHLGEGGMGAVYRARHITLDKQVALKVLHSEFSRKQDFVERFLQEAKAASKIRNDHVIDITDFGRTEEGYVFFTMEFLEGVDLHTVLSKAVNSGQLVPWERAKRIFLQICQALSAAHAQGIIHRDLKPENIFLIDRAANEDYVKLLDFGIAKVQGVGDEGERKLTKTGMLFGTPEYMAPEQARGEKPDHRVDVYAMGCLLFQFLTGTVPFTAESFMAILTQHMVDPVPEIGPELLLRTGAPAGILPVVYRALAKDREVRYENIAELAAAVSNADAPQNGVGRPVRVSTAIVAESSGMEGHSSPKKWMLAGVAAVALLGAGGVVVFQSSDSEMSHDIDTATEIPAVEIPSGTADSVQAGTTATVHPEVVVPLDAAVPAVPVPEDAAVIPAVAVDRPATKAKRPKKKGDKPKPASKDELGDPALKAPPGFE